MKKVSRSKAARESPRVIADRAFELQSDAGEGTVFLRVLQPVPDGKRDFRCDFEIEGLGELISSRGMGVDPIQAYDLALQNASFRLLASSAYQSGRLTYRGAYDLGLRVPGGARSLVRMDLERELTLRQMTGQDDRTNRASEALRARLEDTSKVYPDRPKDAPIILERILERRVGRKRTDVRVAFRKPVPHRLGHWCAFEIEGLLAKPPARSSMLGEDSIGALKHAMCLAMVNIVTTPAYQRGEVIWFGGFELGMPIHEDVEPLIRRDLHAKMVADLLKNPPTMPRKSGRQ